MTAIRNVGELASPYFLVEVWSRRDEIDIDPETFATLKQKTRRIVRDARAFESRGEEPDDEWRARRLELLGLAPLEPLPIALDGTGTTLAVHRNGADLDTVLIGDLPGAPEPDHRLEGAEDPPSTAFELRARRVRRRGGLGRASCGTRASSLPPVERHQPAVRRRGSRRSRRARRPRHVAGVCRDLSCERVRARRGWCSLLFAALSTRAGATLRSSRTTCATTSSRPRNRSFRRRSIIRRTPRFLGSRLVRS